MWLPGDRVLLRFGWSGDLAWVYPVTVVEDSPACVALYLAEDTPIKRPVGTDGSPVPRSRSHEPRAAGPWQPGDARWVNTSVRWLARPGAAHAIGLFWQGPARQFLGWYGNLQAPLLRTALGFDSADHALDVVVAPDRTWNWKDEDEFASAQQRGVFSPAEATAIRAEGERVIAAVEEIRWPFNADWDEWQPDPAWPIPAMPDGWDAGW